MIEEIQENTGPDSRRLKSDAPLVCKLHFQNEYLTCEMMPDTLGSGGEVLALVPDLISVLESETGVETNFSRRLFLLFNTHESLPRQSPDKHRKNWSKTEACTVCRSSDRLRGAEVRPALLDRRHSLRTIADLRLSIRCCGPASVRAPGCLRAWESRGVQDADASVRRHQQAIATSISYSQLYIYIYRQTVAISESYRLISLMEWI
jgi:hypothetical protein